MVQCSGCKATILVTQKRIKCTEPKCQLNYHLECVKLNDVNIPRSKWICGKCVVVHSVGETDSGSAPVMASPPPIPSNDQNLILNEIRNLRKEMLDKFENQKSTFENLNAILSKVQTNISELGSKYGLMRADLDEVINSMQFMSTSHDEQKTLNDKCVNNVSDLLRQNNNIQSKLSELTLKIAQMEQYSRETNIEVQGVPERKNENLMTLIKDIGKTVSYNVQDNEIMAFHRVAKLKPDSNRPKNIVVRLNSQRTRDNFLASVKCFNRNNEKKLNTSHVGFTDHKQPIFVTEHLSPENKKLHAATRIAAREKGYKFVWTRNGRIFVRKDVSSGHVIIKTSDCLLKL